jgi:hypothetical protein
VAAREAVVERRRPCPASRCLARAVRLDVNLDSESGRVVSPAVRSLLARAVAVRALAVRALAVRALAAGSELQPPRASRGKVVSQGRAGRVAAAEAAGRVAVAGAVLAVAVLVLAVAVAVLVLAVLVVLVVVLDGQLEGRLPEPAACAARVFADMAHRSRL